MDVLSQILYLGAGDVLHLKLDSIHIECNKGEAYSSKHIDSYKLMLQTKTYNNNFIRLKYKYYYKINYLTMCKYIFARNTTFCNKTCFSVLKVGEWGILLNCYVVCKG